MNEMLQTILDELKSINKRLDTLEEGQKTICDEQKVMNRRLDALEEGQKVMNRRLDTLDEGQKVIRRDIARVDRKLDRLSADVGDTLVYVTDSVGNELDLLKKAK